MGSAGAGARRHRAQPSAGLRRHNWLVAVPYLIFFVFVCLLGALATCVLV